MKSCNNKYRLLTLSVYCTFFLLAGCSSNMLLLLEPSNYSLTKKLLPLEVTTSEQINQTGNSLLNVKDIATQTSYLTIFEREMKQNVLTEGREKFGFIDAKLTYNSFKMVPNGLPFVILSAASLFTFNILGMPFGIHEMTTQIEITIYDKDKVEIKKYVKSGHLNYPIGIYYGLNDKDIYNIKLFKNLLDSFKNDLTTDVDAVNKLLLTAKTSTEVPTPQNITK